MRPVRFIRGHDHGPTRYLAGERAGFPDEVAERLVAAGVASYVEKPAFTAGEVPAPPSLLPEEAGPAVEAAAVNVLAPEPPPDPAVERAAIEAENVSRTTPKSERRKR